MNAFTRMLRKLRKTQTIAYWSGRREETQDPSQAISGPVEWRTSDAVAYFDEKEQPRADTRQEVRPVDVVKEILSEAPSIDMTKVDTHLKIIKRRIRVLQEQQPDISCQDEKRALAYLKNRKRLKRFSGKLPWPITTHNKINELCRQYKLRQAGLSGYYRNLPMEAIDEMEKFGNIMQKLTGEPPRLSLIIDDGGKETKKDPILLAESPFGDWYYVLGAWDKEVEVVDELLYRGA